MGRSMLHTKWAFVWAMAVLLQQHIAMAVLDEDLWWDENNATLGQGLELRQRARGTPEILQVVKQFLH